MTDPTQLTRPASEWFADALRQHVRAHPGSCDDWLALIASGKARVHVIVELAPEVEIRCALQVESELIVFHRTPFREAPRPQP